MRLLYFVTYLILIHYCIHCQERMSKRKTYFISDLLNLLEGNKTFDKTQRKYEGPTVGLKLSVTKNKQTSQDPSSCQLRKQKIKFQFSKNCQKIEYIVLKCDGYCKSKTFFYGDKEINRVQGCKLNINKNRQMSKQVYCTRPLQNNDIQINSKFYAKYDFSLFNLQNMLSDDKWHVNSHRKKNKIYSGYYLLNINSDATCSCQNIQN